MKLHVCSIIALLALGLFVRGVAAQGAAPGDFDTLEVEWTKVDDEIKQLITRYRTAPANEREAMIAQYNALVEQSKQLVPRLRQAAIAAYQVDPKADPRVEQRLIGLVANDVRQDEFDGALQIAKLLADNGVQEPALDTFIGLAAYCVDDFDAAEVHLKLAQASNTLTQEAQVALQDLATAKQAWVVERATREREAQANDLPRVKIETNRGTLVIELYENEAPQAVANFVSLVESGYYDGLTFHRVLPGFMAQGGCPDGTGSGGPGYNIPCECYRDDHRNHFRGTLSMAHAGRDTGGSQFFLTFKRTSHLDGKHTVFGRVVEGLDVLAHLQRRDPSQRGALPAPDKIVKAEVIRKRDHEYKPTKVGG
jgi:cyclophilin family peptidyl-prolyl cis-trans isomerase